MPALGPFSAQHRLTKLDGRTREARLAASTREGLLKHIGHPASATEEMLIERCVQLSVRIALMDRRFAERCEMTEAETNTYLAWSAALSRLLNQLAFRVQSRSHPRRLRWSRRCTPVRGPGSQRERQHRHQHGGAARGVLHPGHRLRWRGADGSGCGRG